MTEPALPLDRFEMFQSYVGLSAADFDILHGQAGTFLPYAEDYADFFHNYLSSIPQTRRILEVEQYLGGLRKNWSAFFRLIFTQAFNHTFQDFLWKSGLRHVQRNIDQRYINMGYCVTRKYLHDLVDKLVPQQEQMPVQGALDKLLDVCLLVATDAFVAATVQCDREMLDGIAHQVRNPVLVIGSFIKKLAADDLDARRKLELNQAVQDELMRLEHMVSDVSVYMESFGKPVELSTVSLRELIGLALDKLASLPGFIKVKIVSDLDTPFDNLRGDRQQLLLVMYYCLRYAFEHQHGLLSPIRIRSRRSAQNDEIAHIEILSSSEPMSPEELEDMFTPFHSPDPMASGLGLAIARLIARKHLGDVVLLSRAPGVMCRISIPLEPGLARKASAITAADG